MFSALCGRCTGLRGTGGACRGVAAGLPAVVLEWWAEGEHGHDRHHTAVLVCQNMAVQRIEPGVVDEAASHLEVAADDYRLAVAANDLIVLRVRRDPSGRDSGKALSVIST